MIVLEFVLKNPLFYFRKEIIHEITSKLTKIFIETN